MNFTREQFEEDRERYRAEKRRLLDSGLTEDHPLVERQQRRIETVDRVLTDPAYGFAEEEV
jgi:hypothetical protein